MAGSWSDGNVLLPGSPPLAPGPVRTWRRPSESTPRPESLPGPDLDNSTLAEPLLVGKNSHMHSGSVLVRLLIGTPPPPPPFKKKKGGGGGGGGGLLFS